MTTDLRNEKIGFKIREHELAKVPLIVVVGDKEVEATQVSVRGRHGADHGTMSLSELSDKMTAMADMKGNVDLAS